MQSFKAIVTRNSNGSATIAPLDGGNPPRDLEMGAEVEITVEVIRTAKEIEDANAKSKAERTAPTPAARKTAGKTG